MIYDIPKKTKGTFNDFIPEGQNAGAMGAGFADFVPEETKTSPFESVKSTPVEPIEPESVKQADEPAKQEKIVDSLEEATPWKKPVYTCDVCDFSSEYKLALAGHKRKHLPHTRRGLNAEPIVE